jgi:HD superfamily phosphodiesterase
MKILPALISFIQITSIKNNIDDSHGISHSMNVLYYSNQIYQSLVPVHSKLKDQESIIFTSALIHDMCDKKYMDPKDGILQIQSFLTHKLKPYEIHTIEDIISTMSYSKVKKQGYPDLGDYQMAYHIVREADLLTAYDIDRSIIYHLHKSSGNFIESYKNARDLFDIRVLQHHRDNLFLTEYSKRMGAELHEKALERIKSWDFIIQSYEKISL